MSFADSACLSAVSEALGHGLPFSPVELAGLRSLTVSGALKLEGLQACTGLNHLRIIGSGIDDLHVAEAMPALAHLELIATRVGSLAGIASCARLERVDLLYTSLTSATDLLGLGSLRRGTLVGNPWDDQSWLDLQSAAASGVLLELQVDYDWKLTRQLWEEHEACWGRIADVMPMLVRPGVPALTTNAYDGAVLVFIRHEMKQPGFSIAGMFSTYADQIACPDLSERARYRTLGSSGEALEWIAGSIFPDDERAALGRFVRRFPSVPFYRASQSLIDLETASDSYALPGWRLDLRRTLDGWLPNHPGTPVRFGEGGRWAGAGKDYYLGLYPHAAEHEDALIAAGFVNVALAVEDPRALLAMRLNGEDRGLYAYDLVDVGQSILEGREPSACFTPVIASYADMLDRIVALVPRDQEPIVAA